MRLIYSSLDSALTTEFGSIYEEREERLTSDIERSMQSIGSALGSTSDAITITTTKKAEAGTRLNSLNLPGRVTSEEYAAYTSRRTADVTGELTPSGSSLRLQHVVHESDGGIRLAGGPLGSANDPQTIVLPPAYGAF